MLRFGSSVVRLVIMKKPGLLQMSGAAYKVTTRFNTPMLMSGRRQLRKKYLPIPTQVMKQLSDSTGSN